MFRPQDPTPDPSPNGHRKPAPNKRGRRRHFSALDHQRRGTYRHDRHGPLPSDPQTPLPVLADRPMVVPRPTVPRKWIRGPADLAAIAAGYRWDGTQGAYAIRWIETQLQLVEGAWSGKPFTLMDWQRDFVMRLFSWVHYNPDWARWTARYRRALLMVPKKNGKSPFAAALGLLLAYGYHHAEPGPETGSEIVIVATDKIQTENVFKHCRRMVKKHQVLGEQCSINEYTCRILHPPTDTVCRTLAHNPDQLEGINPRALVCDELHSWKDTRTWDTIRYAGASRPDFLLLAITTSGDDRQSLCYSQYEYAGDVNAGRIVDHEFLGVIYEAHPDDDWTSPRVWKKANPSLGVTVHRGEIQSACTEAKHNLRIQDAFRRYRLNIWTQAESAWLDVQYWTERAAPIDLQTAADGHTCTIALDLATTLDLAAAAVTWLDHDDDTLHLWTHFWLPLETARRRNHETPFLLWAKEGHITLIEGDTIDYAIIYEAIAQLTKKIYIANLIYDPWNAHHLTRQITDQLGIPRIKFPQTTGNFTGPCKEFERRIIAGTMTHSDNPILNWQAAHALIYTDPSGNIRPIRRHKNDHRTIDGVIASVMSTAQTMLEQKHVDFAFGLN